MSQHVGRNRVHERKPSRLKQAFEETITDELNRALEGNREADAIRISHKRSLDRITADDEKLQRVAKREQDDVNRQIRAIDDQIGSEERRIHILAERGGGIIAKDATRPLHERQGTEVIEGEVESAKGRIMGLKERKVSLSQQDIRTREDLSKALTENRKQKTEADEDFARKLRELK